jgi:hypothetical protein
VEWNPFASGSLIGKATIAHQCDWITSNILIFRRADGSLSAGAPEMPLVGRDGALPVGDDGERRYAEVISFETPAAKTRWNDTIVRALSEAGVR